MAAGGIGALVVSLGLDAAEFISGLTRSEQQAKKFADTLDRNIAAGIVKAQIALEALGAGARLAVDAFKTLTTGAGQFQDLAEKTGASAQDLAALSIAASVAGVGIEGVADSTTKLTRSLVGVDDESKAAGAALKTIGLSVAEFKALDPVAQYEAIAHALAGYADGAGKVAVAQALFGKSGADQLRVMKELEASGGAQVILTQRQIELADDYADRQARATATLRLYAQAAASEALPALNDLTEVAVDFARGLIGIDEASRTLNSNGAVREFAEGVADVFASAADQIDLFVRLFQLGGKTVAGYAAVVAAAAKGEFAQARAIGESFRADIDRVVDRATFAERLAKQRLQSAEREAQRRVEDRGFDPRKAVSFNGVDESAAARLRKTLDGQLQAIRDFAAQQQQIFDFASKYLKGTYDDGLVSARDFYAAQDQIRQAGLANTLAALDKEIAAQRAAAARSLKPEERLDAENKIAEAVRKRAAVAEKAQLDGVLAAQQEGREILALQERYDDLRATILRLSGDTAGAARIGIARQVADARRLLAQQGVDQGAADNLGTLLSRTQDLSQAQSDYNRLLERARNAEEAITLAATESGQSELDTMKAVGAARADSLEQLRRLTDQANELALALGTPEAIAFAERLGLALKKATAEVDPLLQKIRDVGAEAGKAIASNFEDAIVQGKGLRELLKGIDQDLTRILIRNLVTQPLGNALSNIIGGNGQASGGGGLIGAAAGWLSGLFGGGKAIGGPVGPGIFPVAENRPEMLDVNGRSFLLMGSQRGTIDPNPPLGGSRTINAPIYITVPGSTDRRTASQIGAEVSRALAVASVRNN